MPRRPGRPKFVVRRSVLCPLVVTTCWVTTAPTVHADEAALALTNSGRTRIPDHHFSSGLGSTGVPIRAGPIFGAKLIITTDATATTYPSPISVPASAGVITDLDLTLHGVAHTFPEDLQLALVGPQGQSVQPDLTFDDEGAPSRRPGAPPPVRHDVRRHGLDQGARSGDERAVDLDGTRRLHEFATPPPRTNADDSET